MFGFGKGKIDLQVEKTGFAFNESIRGKVRLELSKDVKAKGVFVALLATRENRTTTYSGGRASTQSHTETLYEDKRQLDGEKEYLAMAYNYDFEIIAPTGDRFQAPGGILGGLSKIFSSPIQWQLIAKLDVPGGFDVSKKVKISVT